MNSSLQGPGSMRILPAAWCHCNPLAPEVFLWLLRPVHAGLFSKYTKALRASKSCGPCSRLGATGEGVHLQLLHPRVEAPLNGASHDHRRRPSEITDSTKSLYKWLARSRDVL